MPDVRVNERKPGRTTRGVMKLSFMLWGRRILWPGYPWNHKDPLLPQVGSSGLEFSRDGFFYQRVVHP